MNPFHDIQDVNSSIDSYRTIPKQQDINTWIIKIPSRSVEIISNGDEELLDRCYLIIRGRRRPDHNIKHEVRLFLPKNINKLIDKLEAIVWYNLNENDYYSHNVFNTPIGIEYVVPKHFVKFIHKDLMLGPIDETINPTIYLATLDVRDLNLKKAEEGIMRIYFRLGDIMTTQINH